MELSLFLQWAGAAGLVLGILNTIWTMIGRGTKPFNDRMDKHSADLKEHDRRIQAIEGKQEHSPTSKEVADLRVTVATLDTHVRGLNETIAGLGRTVLRRSEAQTSELQSLMRNSY